MNHRSGGAIARGHEHGERTHTYASLSRINRTFLKWHAPVVQQLTLRQVHHTGKAWGGFPLLNPERGTALVLRASGSDGVGLVVSEFRHADGGNYVMVVNNSQSRSERVLMKFPSKAKLYTYSYGDQGKEHLITDAPESKDGFVETWTWLGPGQETLYSVELAK